MSVSHFIHVNRAGKLVRSDSPEQAFAAAQKGGFVWFNFFQPAREELSLIAEPMGIHTLTIEDCTDENQVPKIEDFPKNTFILFNAYDYSDKKLSIEEVDLIIGENFLVTVSGVGASSPKLMEGIEKMVEANIESARQGPAFLMHVIIDYIVDRKFIALEALEEELDDAEESILKSISLFNPASLMRIRRDLLTLRKSLFHEREIMVKICRKDCPFVNDKAIFHYRDIYDHLAKFFELTENYREIVTSLMEMYLSMVNNQMAAISNATNVSVRRLTLITTVFMPLTLLAGVGGMSEWSMMTGPENWKTSYSLFMVGMAVIGVINYYFIKWLERNDAKAFAQDERKDLRDDGGKDN